jgi:hypothetical protein
MSHKIVVYKGNHDTFAVKTLDENSHKQVIKIDIANEETL